MTIQAVNTLEIKVAVGFEGDFHLYLSELISAFKGLPDCFAYEVARGSQQDNVWLVSGYWASEMAMRQHIYSEGFGSMIWALGCGAVSVRFASFIQEKSEVEHAS